MTKGLVPLSKDLGCDPAGSGGGVAWKVLSRWCHMRSAALSEHGHGGGLETRVHCWAG